MLVTRRDLSLFDLLRVPCISSLIYVTHLPQLRVIITFNYECSSPEFTGVVKLNTSFKGDICFLFGIIVMNFQHIISLLSTVFPYWIPNILWEYNFLQIFHQYPL